MIRSTRARKLVLATTMSLFSGVLMAGPAHAAGDASITVRDGACDLAAAGLGTGSNVSPFQIGTAKQLAEVDDCSGEAFNVTGASSTGTAVTYTLDTASNYLGVGQIVDITGVTPSSLNVEAGRITATTATTITVASTVTDTYVSGGSVNNIYHYFDIAADINLASGNDLWNNTDAATISSVSADGSTVTYTTSAAHGLEAGQQVMIKGVANPAYSLGVVTVAAVPNSTHFTVSSGASSGSSTGGQVNGLGWIPIGNNGDAFTGSIDGLRHTISGLTVNNDRDFVGLFGAAQDATFRNLTLSAVSVNNTALSGLNWETGGLSGWLKRSNVDSVTVSGSVIGGNETGLVAGTGYQYSNFMDVHASGTVGVHSISSTAVPHAVGGAIGGGQFNSTSYSQSYTNIYSSTSDVAVDGLSVDEQLTPNKRAANFVGGFVGIWSGGGLIDGLVVKGSVSGGQYRVGGAIGFGETGEIHNVDVSADVSYDGQGATGTIQRIGGFVGTWYDEAGIYNVKASGDVSVVVTDPTSTRSIQQVGGMFGNYDCCGTVSDSISTGNVTVTNASTSSGVWGVGGFSGDQECCGGFSGSKSTGNVVVSAAAGQRASNIGGFVGYSDWSVGYYAVSATGDVTVTRGDSVGGFIGEACCATSLRHVSATGDVTVSTENRDSNVGGLIGYVEDAGDLSIDRTYATGTVNVTATNLGEKADNVGGLLGYMEGNPGTNARISDSYYRGSVSGVNKVAGLIGYGAGRNIAVKHTYVSAPIVASATSAVKDAVANGGFSDANSTNVYDSGTGTASATGVNPRSSAQMKAQSTYSALGFTFGGNPWRIGSVNGGYPTLNLLTSSNGGGGTASNSKVFSLLSFKGGKAVLSATSKKQLRAAIRSAKAGGYSKILLRAYTSKSNTWAAKRKASVASAYLRARLKGSGIKVVIQGYSGQSVRNGKVAVIGVK